MICYQFCYQCPTRIGVLIAELACKDGSNERFRRYARDSRFPLSYFSAEENILRYSAFNLVTIMLNQSDQMAKSRIAGVVRVAWLLVGASATCAALPQEIAPTASAA